MDLGKFTSGTMKIVKKQKLNDTYENLTFNDFKMQVGEDDQQQSYEEGTHSSAFKWGQLKLLTTELLFLCTYLDDSIDIVIYAGAAPGNHLCGLCKLFKTVEFHLYDTANFSSKLNDCENVTLFKSYFTDNDIIKYNKLDKNYLFISDIRTLTYDRNKVNMRLNQDIIWRDMTLQQDWLNKLNFKHASLKFRLPFPEDFVIEKYGEEVDYLDGNIFKQPYSGHYSTECRLFVNGDDLKMRKWNLKNHEEKMYYHNKIIRQLATYKNVILDNDEEIYPNKIFQNSTQSFMIKRDYDSTYLAYIIVKYMKKIKTGVNTKNFRKLCDFFIKNSI